MRAKGYEELGYSGSLKYLNRNWINLERHCSEMGTPVAGYGRNITQGLRTTLFMCEGVIISRNDKLLVSISRITRQTREIEFCGKVFSIIVDDRSMLNAIVYSVAQNTLEPEGNKLYGVRWSSLSNPVRFLWKNLCANEFFKVANLI